MAHAGVPTLIPGTPSTPRAPLARYRPPQFSGVVREMMVSSTTPGDLVLMVGMSGGTAIAEAVAAGCRVIGLNRNPVELLWLHLDLNPVPARQMQSALTQLGDLPKAGHPLSVHIRRQYESLCPRCHTAGTAEWFAWDRDAGRPFAKSVICARCGTSREGPVDERDLQAAGTFPLTSSPAYHLALSRAAAPNDEARAVELVRLYTGRNLAVLMDIVNRLPQVRQPPDVRRALTGLILEALDCGSSLSTYGAPEERPRSLRTPQRFLERNIWLSLEHALATYVDHHVVPDCDSPAAIVPQPSLPVLLAQPDPGYVLLDRSIHDLERAQLANTVRALIVEVRPPAASFWALSVLWGTWLWGQEVPSAVRGFLRRRRLDWEWYQRSLGVALGQLRPLLRPDASILMLAPTQDPAAVRAVAYAAQAAHLSITTWLSCPPYGYRLALGTTGTTSPTTEPTHTPEQVVAEVSRQVLCHRGEPTLREDIEAASVLQTCQPNLPAAQFDDASDLRLLDNNTVWLRTEPPAGRPLADRVEEETLRLMRQQAEWQVQALTATLYDRFREVDSPDPALVDACINAYAQHAQDGMLALRKEDTPERRQADVRELRQMTLALGRSLGYEVHRHPNGDIVWCEEALIPYMFRCTTMGLLGLHLLKTPPPCDGRRCLVVPGGRAALVALKLRRDVRLQRLVELHRWAFVKFRHLRLMAGELKNAADIEVYLGLDPIVEQGTAQLQLPLEIPDRR